MSESRSAPRPSFPLPSSPLAIHELQPRPLPPVRAPEHVGPLPPLPSPPRPAHPVIAKRYKLSTHLVPAAYPRLTPDVPAPTPPAFSTDKAQWKASVENTLNEILGARIKQWSGELSTHKASTTLLWNCIDRYVRRDTARSTSGKPVTLFFAHANGFPKETWEVTLSRFLAANEATKDPLDIAEVWLWEAVNHGDSALVNAGKLGGIYDWADNSRDILNFLLSHLPSSFTVTDLPTHLPRLSESVSSSRRASGFQDRTFVAVGHSFGGCTSYRAALEHPILFSSLVLVDPIISPRLPGTDLLLHRQYNMSRNAIRRRSHWSSREEALQQFKQSPFFGAWDPAVLELYVNHGTYDDPHGGVSLKMSGLLEAMVFSEALTCNETWQLAPALDPRITLRWIMPGHPNVDEIPREHLVWRRPENSSNVIIPKSGHLIAQEAPEQLAAELAAFLREKYGKSSSTARL